MMMMMIANVGTLFQKPIILFLTSYISEMTVSIATLMEHSVTDCLILFLLKKDIF